MEFKYLDPYATQYLPRNGGAAAFQRDSQAGQISGGNLVLNNTNHESKKPLYDYFSKQEPSD